jgi:energy-coupling factor transporter ATP-binding protein EcfA2
MTDLRNFKVHVGRADGSDVDLDLITLLGSRALVCGSSGCGKSWLFRLIAEQVAPVVPTIILDPEGEYASLREEVDVVLVAADGDFQPTVEAAPAIARWLLKMGTSAVVALDDLHAGEQQQFVAAFIAGLMNAPRTEWRPLLVMLDEAHRFASQQDDSPASGAVADLLSRGRKRGFCAMLATQRLSKLAKSAAAECNNVLIGQTTLDIDVVRARDVLGLRSKAEAQQLRELAPGHWFAIGPALRPRHVGELIAAKVKTSHPGPGLRHTTRPPAPSAALRKKLEELAGTIEASKGQILTLEQAQQRIAVLEARRGPSPEAIAEAELRGRMAQIAADAPTVAELRRRLGECIDLAATVGVQPETPAPSARAKAEPSPSQAKPIAPSPAPSTRSANGLDRMLLVLAQHQPHGCDRRQLALLAEMSPKGGSFTNNVSKAHTSGWIEKGPKIRITKAGLEHLGDYPPLPDGRALVEHWLTWCGSGGARRMLQALLEAGPEGLDRPTLAERSTMDARGGSFTNNLSILRGAGLAEGKTQIKAADVLLRAWRDERTER